MAIVEAVILYHEPDTTFSDGGEVISNSYQQPDREFLSHVQTVVSERYNGSVIEISEPTEETGRQSLAIYRVDQKERAIVGKSYKPVRLGELIIHRV